MDLGNTMGGLQNYIPSTVESGISTATKESSMRKSDMSGIACQFAM